MVILPSRRKNFVSQGGGGENDPYWNNVVFLSKFDETGLGLGIFRDVSNNPTNVTRNAASVLLNTGSATVPPPKFGAGNIYFSSTTSSAGIGTNISKLTLTDQEWTLEGWFMALSPGPNVTRSVLTTNNFTQITSTTTPGRWNLIVFTPTSTNIATNINLGTGIWRHITIQRARNVSTFRYDAYIDGVFTGTVSNTGNHTASGLLNFSTAGGNNSLVFMVDELRITTGVARYPTGVNFTPPTQPYPSQ
jgi:hypothetical protein